MNVYHRFEEHVLVRMSSAFLVWGIHKIHVCAHIFISSRNQYTCMHETTQKSGRVSRPVPLPHTLPCAREAYGPWAWGRPLRCLRAGILPQTWHVRVPSSRQCHEFPCFFGVSTHCRILYIYLHIETFQLAEKQVMVRTHASQTVRWRSLGMFMHVWPRFTPRHRQMAFPIQFHVLPFGIMQD